jgi:type II secretory pathway component PulJ
MFKCLNIKKREGGVTLIELLVAVAAFGVFIGAISGLLISAVQAQRRILATQELLSQASYVLEYMGRAIRMALKDANGDCLVGHKDYNFLPNPEPLLGVNGIRFLKSTASSNICQEFYLDNSGTLMEKKSDTGTWTDPDPFPLISSSIQVVSFRVDVSGDDILSDNLQPRVTIFLDLAGKATSAGQPKVQVQTSISQRSLDATF